MKSYDPESSRVRAVVSIDTTFESNERLKNGFAGVIIA
jgi:hypothetical protein